ncbi:MAG: response regulator transcription factor [Bacteroidales bacterium]|jgi:DNA-binding NarL/FixJ family response regulator|nr:response regulator transcription factor [Bacteroidales bacterium]
MSRKQRILLVENATIVAEGLQAIIATMQGFEVVDTEENMEWIFERITVFKPDIIIINPSVIDFSRRMNVKILFQNFPQLPVVALLHNHYERQLLKQFHECIDIEDDKKKIEQKLRALSPQKAPNDEALTSCYELSARETDILIEVAKGLINKEIANKLNISIHTVISHRKNIIKKTGIKSVAGLTVYALLNNLIDENDM